MLSVRILGYNGLYATKNQPSSGYLVSFGNKKILIDCGFGVFSSLISIMPPEKLDLIILSHTHFDHMGDIGAYNYYLQQKGVRLPLYMPVEREIDIAYSKSLDYFEITKLDKANSFHFGGATFTLFKMKHPVLTFGIRIEYEGKIFAYTADTNICTCLEKLLASADLAISDAAFTKGSWSESRPHLSSALAAEYARKSGVKKLVLSHLAPNCNKNLILNEALFEFDRAEIAELKQYDL